jgi:thiol-disulfide isomerase/thioredoxin
MKLFLLLFSFILLADTTVTAQKRPNLTDNSIVRDSSGIIYPPAIWKTLLLQGDYGYRPIDADDENSEFILIKLTEKQKKEQFERMPKPKESTAFRNGQKISFSKIEDINGNKFNLKDLTGKITVINFWFINCKPCRMEIPALNDLVAQYKTNTALQFIGIALDDKYRLDEFLKTMPFNYAIIDNGRYLAEMYRIQSYPTHVIVDPEGKVYFHTTGLAQNTIYWLNKSIFELLNKNGLAVQ